MSKVVKIKKTGVVLLLLGSVSVYFGTFRPLYLAQSGESSRITPGGVTAVATILLISGVVYLLSPKFVERHLGIYPEEEPSYPTSVIGWIFWITCLAFGIGLDIWVQSYFRAYNSVF